MSMIPNRMLVVAIIAATVGAGLLPTEVAARTRRYYAARAHGAPATAFGFIAPPVFYRAPPPPVLRPVQNMEAACDVARDWNC